MKVITIFTAVVGSVTLAMAPSATTNGSGGIDAGSSAVPAAKPKNIGSHGDFVKQDSDVPSSDQVDFDSTPDGTGLSSKDDRHSSKRGGAPGKEGVEPSIEEIGGWAFAPGYAYFGGNLSGSAGGGGQNSTSGGGSGGGGRAGSRGSGDSGGSIAKQGDGLAADGSGTDSLADNSPEEPPVDDAFDPTIVSITAVPEPSTALFGLALTAAVGFARRRSATPAV